MSEKINGQGFRPLDLPGSSRKAAVDGTRDSGAASRPGTDTTGETVSLTRSAVLLGRLEELISNVPVVNTERVDAIKDALASGAYEVDAQAVADRLIQLERELF